MTTVATEQTRVEIPLLSGCSKDVCDALTGFLSDSIGSPVRYVYGYVEGEDTSARECRCCEFELSNVEVLYVDALGQNSVHRYYTTFGALLNALNEREARLSVL